MNAACRGAAAALAIVGAVASSGALAQTEIHWWHAMAGALGDRVGDLAKRFNASQKEYKVVPVFKGSYDETLAAGIAAFRAKSPPHILQVYEVGTATMMAAKGAIRPVHEVMAGAGKGWNPAEYVPAVASYYTDHHGKMLSLPFNSSTPVFFYNKDVFKKAGIEAPPKTWRDVQEAAQKAKAAGAACGFTTGWQSWVMLENMSAWHNQEFATRSNGFEGFDAKLAFNTLMLVRHISLLSSWAKGELFTYGGRRNEPEAKFFNGECAMLTSSSAAYANIKKNAKFEFGVAKLPYYEEETGAPYNTIIGGASLWVMAGKKPAEYKGVARFFEFLSSPVVAAEWHQETGYLPITNAAYLATQKSGFYDKHPGTDISVQQMNSKKPTKFSKGVRLGNFVQIRGIIDEELEAVWAGKKAPKDALDEAVKRGNEQLRRFEQANKSAK
ncbi:MAG: sn-glycerol-3-phosphate ABC transporter substrate-binding protein UgpB [Burkholderiales bacterium]|nr:sn-glycerol-3-phosphate ABC transporter substrate-binding protein UgpB [Burkholderiales bacterium]